MKFMSSDVTFTFYVFIFYVALPHARNGRVASKLETTEIDTLIRCSQAFPQVCLVEKSTQLKRVHKSMDKLFSFPGSQALHFYSRY